MDREEAIEILDNIARRNVFCTLEEEPLEAFWMATEALREQEQKEQVERSKGCEKERKINDWNGLVIEERRLYNIWNGMLHRCEDPKREKFQKYGAAGISVCEEWHNFELFVKWAKENGYDDSLTLDRINSRGNYEPSNCRWADAITQSTNRGNARKINIDGVVGTPSGWSRVTGISRFTISDWVRNHGEEYAASRIKDHIMCGRKLKEGEDG